MTVTRTLETLFVNPKANTSFTWPCSAQNFKSLA